jgi:FKBP-type peptidyl-prolyl cis-trans isomerase FkpA
MIATRMPRVVGMAGIAIWTMLAACAGSKQAARTASPVRSSDSLVFAPALGIDLPSYTRTKSGAYYRDIVEGTGVRAAIDRKATLRYVVFLPGGELVEKQSAPVEVTIGPDIIRGWQELIPGMRAGGVRRMVLPPSLAYGRSAYKTVPPNSTLVFEIELLSVR